MKMIYSFHSENIYTLDKLFEHDSFGVSYLSNLGSAGDYRDCIFLFEQVLDHYLG